MSKNLANAVRVLGAEMINKANSGHTGIVLGTADIITELFKNHLVFNPEDPTWPGRDRFVLSAGHGSAGLYATLFLAGYPDITMDDLKNFRQIGAKTTGHPEYGILSGVESSTGPLGEGIGNAVGMALGQKIMSARYGKLFDSKVYCLLGDGCLMEGVAYEAMAFAGHQKLDNLIVLWDDNKITIDGSTELATSEDMKKRVESCGFVFFECDGHNPDEINKAINDAKTCGAPAFIDCHTHIGFGSVKQDSCKIHGSPLNDEELAQLKQKLDWTANTFEIPEDILNEWRSFWKRNEEFYHNWVENFNNMPDESKDKLSKFLQPTAISAEAKQNLLKIFAETESEATRKSSGKVLEVLIGENPNVIGGTADLGGSINTENKNCLDITPTSKEGNYIHYGIREHAMGAIMNGLATGGFLPYAGTFLSFIDAYKIPVRMSALMQLRMFHILTHDSFYLGEDGPTHQPIEQLDSLRLTPNLLVFRPCDLEETIQCYEEGLMYQLPSAMILTRQNLPQIHNKANKIENGGYVIYQTEGATEFDVCVITSGSEVSLSIEAVKMLEKQGKTGKVVSMYCYEIFSSLDDERQFEIIYKNSKCVAAVEAGTCSVLGALTLGGLVVNIQTFGASGKAKDLAEAFGFTPESVSTALIDYINVVEENRKK